MQFFHQDFIHDCNFFERGWQSKVKIRHRQCLIDALEQSMDNSVQ